jgi:MFS superfamily sulfate permease-like transporter
MKQHTDYWFIRKTYGYGWTPATWQGWMVIGVFVLLLILLSQTTERMPGGIEENWLSYLLQVVGLTCLLLAITAAKGEQPRWQWGPETKKSKTSSKRK